MHPDILARQQKLLEAFLPETAAQITQDGRACFPMDLHRESLWVAYGLLFSREEEIIAKANRIIENCQWTPCHFMPMIALQIYVRHKAKLTPSVQESVVTYIKESLPEMIGNPEFEFVGVNDNFPCMATYTAVLGGRLLGNPAAYAWGMDNLRSFCKLFQRRGLPSEHTSPTYTPIQVLAMAELATFAQEGEEKELALLAERYLEEGIFAFYHPGMGKMCGPYSRTYTVDAVGCVHMMDFWLYTVVGVQTVSALEEMFSPEKINRVLHHNNRWFNTMQFVWLAMTDYHLSDTVRKEAFGRKYPYEVRATCEYSSSRSDLFKEKEGPDAFYPATENDVACYMTENYAVGVSKLSFHSGEQTENFHLMCKKQDRVSHSAHLQTLYLRYILNDEPPRSNVECLSDKGRKIALSNQNIGFVGYRPIRRLVGETVTSLKLSLLLPQIYEGDFRWEQRDNRLYLQIYNTYVAFFSLCPDTVWEREDTEEFCLFSLYNYRGDGKTFSQEEYAQTVNGLAYVVEDASSGTFEAFMEREFTLTDRRFRCSHSRQTLLREIFFAYDGKSLEIRYDVEGCGIQYALRDGQLIRPCYFTDTQRGELDAAALRTLVLPTPPSAL